MRGREFEITLFDIIYENGETEIKSFTAKELGAFKRSNQYKKILSKKKLAQINLVIKMPIK
jgi:hypothetical protein